MISCRLLSAVWAAHTLFWCVDLGWLCVLWRVQGSRNVVYLCQSFVSEACLAEKSPDACVNELIDRQLAQKTQQAAGVPLAAIIAPIVVVGEST